MALDLAKATALILALGLLQDLNLQFWHQHPNAQRLTSGLIFGIMSALAMSLPIRFEDGVIFDSRSVVLSMAGLFGGGLAATIALLFALAYRLVLGGAGVTVGLIVIVLSVGLGLLYRFLVQRQILAVTLPQLLGFGAMQHGLILLAFLWLPISARSGFFNQLAVPYFAVMTIATALLGMILRSIHSQVQTKLALIGSESRLRAITEASPDTSLVIDETGLIQEIFSPNPTLLGIPIEDIRGKTVQHIHPSERATILLDYVHEVIQEKTAPPLTYSLPSGAEIRHYEARGRAIDTPMDNRRAAVITLRDVTARMRNEEDLRIAGIAFENQSGMVITNAQAIIVRINRAFSRLTGYSEAEAKGQHIRILSSGKHDRNYYQAMWQEIHRSGRWEGEVWNRHRDGNLYPAQLSISAVYNEQQEATHYIGALHDLTRHKQFEEEVHSLSFFDQLTSLPNRRLFNNRLRNSLELGNHGALLFINLDDFKHINELYGHYSGDILLQRLAQRLRFLVEPDHIASRFGADEFVILLDNLSSSLPEAKQAAEEFALKVLDRIHQPFKLEGQTRQITASIGIVIFGHESASVNDILLRADLAMHEAKRRGKNRLYFFDPVMQQEVTARLMLEDDLRVALRQKQFELYYQPQVDALGRVGGIEALARWRHPVRGLINPGEFIPIAEAAGLMPDLGHELLRLACSNLRRWQSHPQLAHLSLSVNLSVAQIFADNFVESLLKLLEDTGAPANKLILELTETLLLNDLQHAQSILKALGAYGICFSIDDFGTGYSSLSYLQRLPLHELKIDRSFVSDLPNNSSNAAIVRTILALAHTLGLQVVAEGVETENQWIVLRDLGCHYFQGYLFSRPRCECDLKKWLEQHELSPTRLAGNTQP